MTTELTNIDACLLRLIAANNIPSTDCHDAINPFTHDGLMASNGIYWLLTASGHTALAQYDRKWAMVDRESLWRVLQMLKDNRSLIYREALKNTMNVSTPCELDRIEQVVTEDQALVDAMFAAQARVWPELAKDGEK